MHDVGYIDSGLNGSHSSLVMCDEIIGMIRKIGRGIEVNDETLAVQSRTLRDDSSKSLPISLISSGLSGVNSEALKALGLHVTPKE